MTSSPTAVGLAPLAGRTSFFFRTNYYSSLGFAKEAAKAYSLAGLDLLLEKSPIDIEQQDQLIVEVVDPGQII